MTGQGSNVRTYESILFHCGPRTAGVNVTHQCMFAHRRHLGTALRYGRAAWTDMQRGTHSASGRDGLARFEPATQKPAFDRPRPPFSTTAARLRPEADGNV